MADRILYASLVDLSLPNGPGVNERGFLAELLHRFGSDLHAVVPVPARGMPNELSEMSVSLIPSGRSVRSFRGWCLANLTGGRILVDAVRRFKPDLVVMRAGGLPVPQHALARSQIAPYAIKTAGDLDFHEFYGRSIWRKAARPLNDRMWKQLMAGAICVDVVSSAQRQAAINRYPEMASRIHVVDNGVAPDLFTPDNRPHARQALGFRPDECVVGYVGTQPMRRGGKEVIDVVAGLRDERPVRGLVVGDSGQADDVRDYARSRGVEDAVVVYGEADYEDVPALMACLDIGLSIRRPAERSQSELKVRQYLATGLCVVGTAVSNDFLRGMAFARVVNDHEPSTILRATADLLSGGLPGLSEQRAQARAFATSSLSIRVQTDRRLELWGMQATSARRELSDGGWSSTTETAEDAQ